MRIRSLISADSATLTGVGTAAGVYLIYNNAVPTLADVRSASPHDGDAETARKHAAWASAALIGAVFLVSRNLDSFIISGSALIALDLMHKHANTVNPHTGKADVGYADTPTLSTAYSMPEYSSETA